VKLATDCGRITAYSEAIPYLDLNRHDFSGTVQQLRNPHGQIVGRPMG
jgi:hypothetical protein